LFRPRVAIGMAVALSSVTPGIAAAAGMSVAISAPSPAAGTIAIVGSVVAARTRVVRLDIYVDGSRARTCKAVRCTATWDTTGTPNGRHIVHAQAVDSEGRVVRSARRGVIIANDVTPPTVRLRASLDGGATVPLAVDARDASGIARIELLLDGATLAKFNSGGVRFDWDSATTSDGTHTLQGIAHDGAGNVGFSEPVSIVVRNGAASRSSLHRPRADLAAETAAPMLAPPPTPVEPPVAMTMREPAAGAAGAPLDRVALATPAGPSSATDAVMGSATSPTDRTPTSTVLGATAPAPRPAPIPLTAVAATPAPLESDPPPSPPTPAPASSGPGQLVTMEERLGILAGPLTTAGTGTSPHGNALVAQFDAWQLRFAHQWGDCFPCLGQTPPDANFYDLVTTTYMLYYRTGDPHWLERARTMASQVRDSWNYSVALVRVVDLHDWSVGGGVYNGRNRASLGLAIHALEAGDEATKRIVYYMGEHAAEMLDPSGGAFGMPVFPFYDGREAAGELTALLGALALGYEGSAFSTRRGSPLPLRERAAQIVNQALAKQRPDGRIEAYSEYLGMGAYVSSYMAGIFWEAAILYDRVIGDPRIVPAMQRWADWTWANQWNATALAFRYQDVTAQEGRPMPAGWPAPVWSNVTDNEHFAALNGLLMPAWGYLYSRTGDPKYKAQAELMLQGLMRDAPVQTLPKQFPQMYRSSPRYFGFTQSR
jgi:Big-like domain-containing protein